jgi:thiol-disulfide isomerase/thioredoxin
MGGASHWPGENGALPRRRFLVCAATLLAVAAPRKPAAGQDETRLKPPSVIVPVTPPKPLPPLVFTTLDGRKLPLAAFAGKPLVLNFWATWCMPCVAELPELDQLAAQGIQVLAVSADHRGADAVKPFLATRNLDHLTIALDRTSEATHEAGVFGFPTTFVLDTQGRERGRLEGPAKWSEAADTIRHLAD